MVKGSLIILSVLIAGMLWALVVELNLDIRREIKKNDDNSFNSHAAVQCNRFYGREIGLVFNPPISSALLGRPSVISGMVHIVIDQGGTTISDEEIDFKNSIGGYYSTDGIHMLAIYRFPPWEFFCTTQRIRVVVKDVNPQLFKNSEVLLYISRDRRK